MNNHNFENIKIFFNIHQGTSKKEVLMKLGLYEHFEDKYVFEEKSEKIKLMGNLVDNENLIAIKEYFKIDMTFGIDEVFDKLGIYDEIMYEVRENRISSKSKYEYEIVDKIYQKNLLYSLLLGIMVPILSIIIIKDFKFFHSLVIDNTGKLIIENIVPLIMYLIMVLYIGINCIRYLRGILLIHSQIKYVGSYFLYSIEFKDCRKVLNIGIWEIMILFALVVLIIKDFQTNYISESASNLTLLKPMVDSPNSLMSSLRCFIYIFSIGIILLTITDIWWLKRIKKSIYFNKADEYIKEYNKKNGNSVDYYLKSFIETFNKQWTTSFLDIIGALFILIVNIFDIRLEWNIIPFILLFFSFYIEFFHKEVKVLEKIFHG